MSASLDLLPGDVGTYDIFNLIHSFSLLCSYKEKVGSLRRELQGAKSLAEDFKVTNAFLIPELFCTILRELSVFFPARVSRCQHSFVKIIRGLFLFLFVCISLSLSVVALK